MTLRALFFDLDDTLCYTIGCRPQRARKAFEPVCREQPHLDIDLLVSRVLEEVDGPRSGRGIPAVLEAIGCEKPDPRIFQHALALAGVRADEAVFVGDRLDVDIAGAKTAGMRAVWFNHWGGTLDPDVAQPDAVITHFAELLEALT